jgi:D-alanyl-D-alanine carboxypeptidase
MTKAKTLNLLSNFGAIILGFVLLALLCLSWAQFRVGQKAGWQQTPWTISAVEPIVPSLQSGLDIETLANKNLAGQLVHVLAPALDLDISLASGDGMKPNDDARIASNIKPFIAAAVLKLSERGSVNIDAPMEPYLSIETRGLLKNSGRDVSMITVRQLLNHSSGLADYGNSRLFQLLGYVPTAFGLSWQWRAGDQLWFAFNMTKRSPAGERFDYSDTNYLLLADLISTATSMPNRGEALRRLLDWSKIGAPDTYWEGYEPKPQSTRLARHFRGGIEDTKLDVSFDQHGGGGLVMSMSDLAHAHRAVMRGEVFGNPNTMTALMRTKGTAEGSGGYGLGLFEIEIAGETCFAHGGRWGTHALTCPNIDLTIARFWGQSNASLDVAEPNGLASVLVKVIQARQLPQANSTK